jgi:hypothetical protein
MVKRERDILWHRIPCTCVPALLRRQRQTAAVCFRGSSLDGWEYFLVDRPVSIFYLSAFPVHLTKTTTKKKNGCFNVSGCLVVSFSFPALVNQNSATGISWYATRRLVYMQPHKLTRACAPEQWRSFFVLETKPCHS